VLDFTYTPAVTLSNVRDVYYPGSNATIPVKINDRGQIVGLYFDAAGAVHGFLFSNGQYSSIDFPGAVATEALAINNWDVPAIAGDYTDSSGKVHGFVLVGKLYLPVNAGFAANLSVRGINDFAQMTGAYDQGGTLGLAPTFGFTGFLGFLTPLDFPVSPFTQYPVYTVPYSLNNKNEVAGQVQIQTPNFLQQMPFLEGGGNFQPIADGTAFSAAAALGNNDAGVLVGWFQNPNLGPALYFGAIAFPLPEAGVTPARIPVQLPLTVALHSIN
jgi:probable HAF family extracellular repeat protein